MAMRGVKLHWMIGALFAVIFIILMLVRLGLLEKSEEDFSEDLAFRTQTRADRDVWMNIYQEDRKIGYAHRQFFKTLEGYKFLESVFMQINTMGMVQDIRFKTEGNLHHSLSLSSFNFELLSSLFRFKVRGVLKDKMLTLFIKSGTGSEQKIDLPLIKKEIHLPSGILELLSAADLKPGDSRTFHVFDPMTTTERPVKVLVLDEETISIMEHQEEAKKVSVDFMGVSQLAWIGKDGTVLREKGSLGMRLEQVTREEALQRIAVLPGTDLAEFASIPANKFIRNVGRLNELKLKLEGIEVGSIFLNGGRQSLQGNVLTIRRESISNHLSYSPAKKMPEDIKPYLKPTTLIQCDHPEIQAKTKEIVSANDTDIVKANKLVTWVHENIQKKPVLSVPNALEILHNRVGDCNEHAVLLTALARAAGIPAEVEAGLVYQRGRFYYHAWNILYLGTWITADSVMGQLPADVTHLRLVRGAERQIDLVRLIGKARIEIVNTSK
jgi:hypothetical protein